MICDASTEHNASSGVDYNESESDSEVPDAKHTALLEAVSQLDGKQRIRAPTRTEPTLHVSEFHLVGSGSGGKNKIYVTDLAKVLGKTSSHVEIGRKIQSVQKKSKTLPKPLEKNVSEKVRRSVGFENVKQELGKWEAVVHRNRSVDTLSFPLRQPEERPLNSNSFIAKLKSQKPNELEARVAEILSESPSAQNDIKEEEDKEYSMNLEELLEHRKEMAKMRALQSYKAAKAARHKRIKSKKYHRMQRREAVRKQIKDFEQLQKTDPEAALQRLEELDRARAQERATLRHRSTGQWARSKAVRAKYDNEARQVLAEQLAISRELTHKVSQEVDSGLESEAEVPEVEDPESNATGGSSGNPWVVKTSAEINQFVSGYRKYWEEQNKSKTGNESLDKSSSVSNAKLEDVESVNNSKRKKLIESVVESVVLIEGNPGVQTGVELHENYSGELRPEVMERNKRIKNLSKVKCNYLNEGDETVKEKVNKRQKISQHKYLLDKRRKLDKEQYRQAVSATDACSVVSTSVSWVVTEVTIPEDKRCSESRRKKNKMELKKSTYISSIDVESKTTGQLEVDADMKIDDLFEEAEERLKERVKEKVHTLQSHLEKGKKLMKKPSVDISDLKFNGDKSSLEMKKSITRPVLDEELGEVARGSSNNNQMGIDQSNVEELALLSRAGQGVTQHSTAPSTVCIDPNNFMPLKQKQLMSQIPDVMTKGDEAMDDDEEEGVEDNEDEREKLIAEAFADDDVVADFRDEKQDLIEKSKPKDIDMTLPGWGDWGGPNIQVSKRKKRRFIIKVPKDAPRRDDNKGNVIINEDKDTKIKQHQVSELPFPFERVQDFEASIRAPVGRDWVPETAHRKTILPAVRTKLGAAIEPMDEDALFSKKKKTGKKKKYIPI